MQFCSRWVENILRPRRSPYGRNIHGQIVKATSRSLHVSESVIFGEENEFDLTEWIGCGEKKAQGPGKGNSW